MGCGIAAKLAAAGMDVILHDSAPHAERRIQSGCGAIFEELYAAGVMTEADRTSAAARVHVGAQLEELAGVHTVIEAIFESLPAKWELYSELERTVSATTTIASSTSGFPPAALFKHVRRAERFLVAHFWNPPHVIPVVELLGGVRTAPGVIDATIRLLSQCGCTPVELRKPVPGFVGNRIQFAVLREALYLLREGVADAETIDTVVKQTLGRRYRFNGPLEGADAGGLQTFLQIARNLLPVLAKGEDVLDTLKEHVERGEKGRASGRGIYVWDQSREEKLCNERRRMLSEG